VLQAGLLLGAAIAALAPTTERPAAPAAVLRWLAEQQPGEPGGLLHALLSETAAPEARLRALAERGEAWAALNLGLIAMETGRVEEALVLLRQAAERGNRPAQHQLARLLARSAVDRESLIEAFVWSGLAARADNAAAERLNGQLRRRLDEAERRQGNERIWHWRPR